MFDWLFGSSKPKQQASTSASSKVQKISEQDRWAYDFIKQYLVSPIWRNPLLDFIESNCYIFEDVEENKFEYTKIHKQFVELCTLLLESIVEEIGITFELLEVCIINGIVNKKDQRIFQQVLLCDNFLAFKKIMISKNKELEIAAIQAENQLNGVKISSEQQQIDAKELERLQIEKAIALSLAMEEKIKQQEEKQLEQAIRLSHIENEKETKKSEKDLSSLKQLPPIVIGSTKQDKPLNENKEEEQVIIKEIEKLRIIEEGQSKEEENSNDRKKRLLEQRELIRKKKVEERKQQLTAFVQNKSNGGVQAEKSVSAQQLERRKKLMKRLKEQLKEQN